MLWQKNKKISNTIEIGIYAKKHLKQEGISYSIAKSLITTGHINLIFSFSSSNVQNNGAGRWVFILFIIDWIAELAS